MPFDATRMREEPLVLLVGGTPRSGTTALTDLLNLHGDVALLSEYPFADFIDHLSPLFEFEARVDGMNAVYAGRPTCVADDAAPVYRVMAGEGEAPRRFPRRAELPAIAAHVLAAALGKVAPQVVGAKSPLYLLDRRNQRLSSIFARMRHLLLLRNPLDQINSSMNRRNRTRLGIDQWHVQTVEAAIAEYRAVLRATTLLALKSPDDVFVVQFEALARDQEAVIREVQAFIDVPPCRFPASLSVNPEAFCVLSDAELAAVHASLGLHINAWETFDFGPGRRVLGALTSMLDSIPFRQQVSDLTTVTGWGWSDFEPDGVWTDANEATLVFGPANPAARCLVLEVTPLLPRATGNLGCRIEVNDQVVFDGFWCAGADAAHQSSLVFEGGFRRYLITIDHAPLSADSHNMVRFMFTGVSSPQTEGINDDTRRLAMKLHSLRLDHHVGGMQGALVTVTPKMEQLA